VISSEQSLQMFSVDFATSSIVPDGDSLPTLQ
jgi:hypothetical protein